MAFVHLVALQPISGAETPDRPQHVSLEPLAPLEVRLFLTERHEKGPNQRAQRGVPFGRLDPRSTVDSLRK